MFIDSHQHYWQIGRHGHEWPGPDLAAIHRDFAVEDLLRTTAGLPLAGTVVVQSQPSDVDTDWLLDMAAHHDLIQGVVGWIDFTAKDAASRLKRLSGHAKFKGVRPMLQSLPDGNWILTDQVQPALAALNGLNLCFDALVFTRHLAAIAELARRYPRLSIVIDHAGKPPIAQCSETATRQWRDDITRVAAHANVSCKLSGLFTEMSPQQSPDAAIPYADHVLTVFGSERVMWGSDWPVLNLRDSYANWHGWTLQRIAHFNAMRQAQIMGGNAQRIYQL